MYALLHRIDSYYMTIIIIAHWPMVPTWKLVRFGRFGGSHALRSTLQFNGFPNRISRIGRPDHQDLRLELDLASEINKLGWLEGLKLKWLGKGVCCRPCCLVFVASSILFSPIARTARASLTRALSLRLLRPRTFNCKIYFASLCFCGGENLCK